VKQRDVLLLLKFHPLTKPEIMDEYRELAAKTEGMLWIDDYTVTKYMLMADAMISDTSSTIYEFLLLNKPVITLRAVAKDIYWRNMQEPEELLQAYDEVTEGDGLKDLRRWVIDNYDPWLDGQVGHRMLEGARDYIRRHGVPAYRKVNLWRKYTSIKGFGRIKRH
jgi:CDP-glycerol glycerophosphotransferase (TagB/SpsB family)